MEKKPLPGRCPACGSTNIQGEPLYPYDEDEYGYDEEDVPGNVAVFCVSCGHYLGETDSSLLGRMQELRGSLGDWLRQAKTE